MKLDTNKQVLDYQDNTKFEIVGGLVETDTWNPSSIADGEEEAKEVTVTGASLGDMVLGVSFSLDVEDLVLDAHVTAADTVTCVLANNTGSAVDLASGTVKVLVIPVSKT